MNSMIGGVWQRDGVLGSGSFAVVWRARHAVSGELAAVKEINMARLSSKLQSSLASEVSVLKRTNHKNLVALRDIVQEGEDRLYLVLEYCGGGDLGHFLRRNGRVSEATTQHLLVQLAEGLRALRTLNLVHRDLKPQNLLLTDNTLTPHLKIADFGFARNLQPQGLAETLCGSPLYMAPEILQLHKYNAKADLWSVGAIMFELLAGKPPFNGVNHLQLLQNIERGEGGKLPVDVAAALSPSCKHLLHHLLRRNPLERISYEEFFSHPFITQRSHMQLTVAPSSAPANAHSSGPSAAAVAGSTQQQQQVGLAAQQLRAAGAAAQVGVATGAGLVASGVLRPHAPQQPRVAVTGALLGVHEATGISVHTAVMQKPQLTCSQQLAGNNQQPVTPAHGAPMSDMATRAKPSGALGTELEYTDIDLGPPSPTGSHTPHGHPHTGVKHETTPGGLSVIEEVDDYVVVSTEPSPSSSPSSSMVGAGGCQQTGVKAHQASGGSSSATASQVLGASWAGSRGRGAWDALSRMGLPPRLVASAASQLRNAAAASSHGVNQWVAPLGQLAAQVTQHVTPSRPAGPPGGNSARSSPAASLGPRSPSSSRPGSAGGASMQQARPQSSPTQPNTSSSSNSASAVAAGRIHMASKASAALAGGNTTNSSSPSPMAGNTGQKSDTSVHKAASGSNLSAEQLAQLVRVPEVMNPLDLVQRVLLVLVEVAVKGWDAALLEAEVACETKLSFHAQHAAQQQVGGAAKSALPASAVHHAASLDELTSYAQGMHDALTETDQSHILGAAQQDTSANPQLMVARAASGSVTKPVHALPVSRQASAPVMGITSSPHGKAALPSSPAAKAMPAVAQHHLEPDVAAAVTTAATAAAQVLRRAAAEFMSLHLLCSQLLHAALQAADQQVCAPTPGTSKKSGGHALLDTSSPASAAKRTPGTDLLPASPHAGSPPNGHGLQARSLLVAHARSVLTRLQERTPAVCAQLLPDQQLPDAAQLLYCVAGRLSRHAALDEVMGQYNGSVQQYAKAADLLLLLLTAGTSTWGVLRVLPHDQVQQAHTLYVVLRIRQAACMADLNAQLQQTNE